jgi:hypothetical protein
MCLVPAGTPMERLVPVERGVGWVPGGPRVDVFLEANSTDVGRKLKLVYVAKGREQRSVSTKIVANKSKQKSKLTFGFVPKPMLPNNIKIG